MNTGLSGKSVLITGAASGIGRATALAFAREGGRSLSSIVMSHSLRLLRRRLASLGCGWSRQWLISEPPPE